VDRSSSVGIATGYVLDGLGSNPGVGRDFPHPSTLVLMPARPPMQWVPGLPRGKAAGARCCSSTPSSTEFKERVELFLCSTSGASWRVLGRPLLLILLLLGGNNNNNNNNNTADAQTETRQQYWRHILTGAEIRCGSIPWKRM
jgi:hypothetical protein